MKYFYLAVTVKQDKNETIFTERTKDPEPGFYSYVVKVSENENLVSVLDHIGGLLHANLMPTKKAAAEVVTAWNEAYKKNGTFLFSSPAF